jgi:hypothetical protein
MAYVDAEKKAELAPAIKAVLKKYDMKGTISVGNHMTLIVKIKSGAIDFAPFLRDSWDYQVNEYHIETNYYGVARDFLLELKAAMQGEKWFCEDDAMTDYFHRSHFITINIGNYNKPYVFNKKDEAA